MKHANIAFFVPHNGCPNQCSFCNQCSITGQSEQPTARQVSDTLYEASRRMGVRARDAEIAFFGGSFTAIDPAVRRELLDAAAPFVQDGAFRGIRISTRPDAISPEILEVLKEAGVRAIELGAQSMNDRVLSCNRRGHTASDVRAAAASIQRFGFSLGLQMMTGLYGSSDHEDWETAREFAALKPDTVRIYPTVVMKGTPLGALYKGGEYEPPSLENTVELCAGLLRFFEERHIPVIRLGLHDSPQLRRDALAGAIHPALRELCESKRYWELIITELKQKSIPCGKITVLVSPGEISKAVGQKRSNTEALLARGYDMKVAGDPSVVPGDIKVIQMDKR